MAKILHIFGDATIAAALIATCFALLNDAFAVAGIVATFGLAFFISPLIGAAVFYTVKLVRIAHV